MHPQAFDHEEFVRTSVRRGGGFKNLLLGLQTMRIGRDVGPSAFEREADAVSLLIALSSMTVAKFRPATGNQSVAC
ncbi:MAG TPA: hypothetical protein VNT79_14755 [Phycisphaerae bacterium]|nr:hypothetical protein [Phycisphaerae bacterium]